MLSLLRTLHVLSVALWFGSVAFFTVAGVLLFQAFADVSALPAEERPLWLPVPEVYAQPSPGDGFPEPVRLEQGSRAAGTAVSRIFPFYYGLQSACGVVALITAVGVARSGEGRGHRLRLALLVAGLLTVWVGQWLEARVSELRVPRNELTDRALAASTPSPEALAEARRARADFGRWHGYSLVQNFATLALAAGATLLIPGLCQQPR